VKRTTIQTILAILSLCSAAAACPMCRDSTAVGSGGAGSAPPALFNSSVLCMLGAFFGVVVFLVMKIVGAIRSVDRTGTASLAPHHSI
jgi:hypothetical protein